MNAGMGQEIGIASYDKTSGTVSDDSLLRLICTYVSYTIGTDLLLSFL